MGKGAFYMNQILVIDRLTRDPELRYTPNGKAVTNFTVAVDRTFTNADGTRETDFIDVVAWNKLGEIVSGNLQKGRLVGVEGRLQIRSWEAQDGSKRKSAEIVANSVQFLDGRKNSNSASGEGSAETADVADKEEVPF